MLWSRCIFWVSGVIWQERLFSLSFSLSAAVLYRSSVSKIVLAFYSYCIFILWIHRISYTLQLIKVVFSPDLSLFIYLLYLHYSVNPLFSHVAFLSDFSFSDLKILSQICGFFLILFLSFSSTNPLIQLPGLSHITHYLLLLVSSFSVQFGVYKLLLTVSHCRIIILLLLYLWGSQYICIM